MIHPVIQRHSKKRVIQGTRESSNRGWNVLVSRDIVDLGDIFQHELLIENIQR